MKSTFKTVVQSLGCIVSPAMIIGAILLLKRVEEATGWASVWLFILGTALLGAGLLIFCKLDQALSRR